MPDLETVTQNPSVILSKEMVDIPLSIGEIPGSPPGESSDEELGPFGVGGTVAPPIEPKRAMKAVLKSGALAATCHAVAEGTAGLGYDIEPRFRGDRNTPDSWPPDAKEQYDRLQAFVQLAFVGDDVNSIREGFYRQEHDRVVLGWGGVVVYRENALDMLLETLTKGVRKFPYPTKWLGRFEASGARFTRPDKKPTMTPVPVALDDGRIVWVDMPRYFRRIVQREGQKVRWFKEFGDWRSMDARTGKYGTGIRYTPASKPFAQSRFSMGSLPEGAEPALEVMHWATSFPGAAPYGISGWHSELNAINAADEHVKLLLDYLKSGLHAVILAAANRKFDSATAEAAVAKIDELGRGRQGMASIITMELVPQDSSQAGSGGTVFDRSATGDRGRIILHELTTKLPRELLDNTLASALGSRISEAERIPALLLGRSDAYNFATAAAAWSVVNRLRFMPHHVGREAFLDNFLIQMGVTLWKLRVKSPEWEEREAASSVAQTVGTFGGMTINKGMQLLNDVMGADFTPIKAWWGDIPLKFIELVMQAPDPQAALDALDLPGGPKIPNAAKLVKQPMNPDLAQPPAPEQPPERPPGDQSNGVDAG